MKKKLLATVAAAAVIGFGGVAVAQSQMGGESNKATSGAASGATQEKSGSSMTERNPGAAARRSARQAISPAIRPEANPRKAWGRAARTTSASAKAGMKSKKT